MNFTAMMRGIGSAILVACVMALASSVAAQTVPDTQETANSTQALVDILKDDAARAALIEKLEAAQTGVPEAEKPPELGDRIAGFAGASAAWATSASAGLWSSIASFPQTLSALKAGIMEVDLWITAARDLLLVFIVTYVTFGLLRRFSRGISTRFVEIARSGGSLKLFAAVIGRIIFDVLIVCVAWAIGYVLVTTVLSGFPNAGGQEGRFVSARQTLFLNAFIVVETVRAVLRVILSPRTHSTRLIGIPSEGALILWRWLSNCIYILGYGYLVIVPIGANAVGFRSSDAIGTALALYVVISTVFKVMKYRRQVAVWLHEDEKTDERESLLEQLADQWHWPVLGYLTIVLIFVLTGPGDVILSLLYSTLAVLALVFVGSAISASLSRSSARGVRLPHTITSRLPLVEARVNGFVPAALNIVKWIIVLVVFGLILHFLGLIEIDAWLKSEFGTRLITGFISATAILLVALAIWLVMTAWVDFRLNPYYGKPPSARETTLLTLLRNAVTIALVIITSMIVLSQIGLDIAPLLASAGVLGLAIGFGAQKLVQDIITGVFIQFENAMNVGDVVTVGGTTGVVEKLTVRSASLRDVEGAFHIIPFSSVDMVSNFTRDFSYFVMDMGVGYGESADRVKAAMEEAFEGLKTVEEHAPFILGDLEWFGLNSFGDSAVVFRVRIKTTPGKQWGIGREYNRFVKSVFDAQNIEIPFPHRYVIQKTES